MIYINRGNIDTPKYFSSLNVLELEEDIRKRLINQTKFRQARFTSSQSFEKNILAETIDLFNGKCCYCESPLSEGEIENISRFRPSSSIAGLKKRVNEGYYWLSYKWFNIYLSCFQCHRNKGNYFPIEGKRLLPPDLETFNVYSDLQNYVRNERQMLLDPCDIESFEGLPFKYNGKGVIIPLNEKASITIGLLKLNRDSLIKDRMSTIRLIKKMTSNVAFERRSKHKENIRSSIEEIFDKTNPYNIFCDLTRQIIAIWFFKNEFDIKLEFPNIHEKFVNIFQVNMEFYKELANVKVPLPPTNIKVEILDPSISATAKFSNNIEWIEINDFKCIQYVKLDIDSSSSSFSEKDILLIGENGVGKSTILQAFALAMMGNEQLQNLKLDSPAKLIRRDSKKIKAFINVKFRNDDKLVTVEITEKNIKSNREKLVKPTVGIGSIRRLPEIGENVSFEDDISRILGLFRHDVVYPDVHPWLGNIKLVDSNQFNEAAKAIIDMLMIPDELISKDRMIVRRGGNLTVNVGNGPESINEMCDGHRSVIGYILYILRSLSDHWESSFNAEGIVLIDEIGNHLHPTWKIKVVSLLRKVFPRCMFIISTHDPLCLRSARKGEVWVMNKTITNKEVSIAQKDIPPGLSLESLLTGKWFYMDYTTDEQTSKLIEEHSKEIFSESPDQNRINEIEVQLERTMMQTPFGNTKMDTYFHFIHEIQKESSSKISNDHELRNKLANRIRNQIKS